MKKKIEVKLELNKQTIAKLDPKAMKKLKGGTDPDDGGGSSSDRNSQGSDCSCRCCASTIE